MLHPLAQFDEVSGISSVMLASDDVFDVIREAWLAEQEVAESSELGIGPADGALFKARPAILYKPSYWTSIVVRDRYRAQDTRERRLCLEGSDADLERSPSTGEVDSNDQRPALRHGASRSPGMLRREAFSPGLRRLAYFAVAQRSEF
jgi:hypothetical protein